jgi:hypothetical protein
MKNLILVSLTAFILATGCVSSRSVSPKNPEPQASVRIDLRDGSYREGIIFKGDSLNLYYVDARKHEQQSLALKSIKQIRKLDIFYDFSAHAIPEAEIGRVKSHKNAWLYGGAGFAMGAVVGIGVGIGLYAADQPLAANASILVFGALGAWYFAEKGDFEDTEDAAFIARKNMYKNEGAIQSEKEKLEQLKSEKARLLEEIENKKKEKESRKK